MGATRLASGFFSAVSSSGKRCSYYLVDFVFFSTFSIPTRPASVFQQPRLAEKLELYYNLMTSKLKYQPHEKSTNQRYHHRRAH